MTLTKDELLILNKLFGENIPNPEDARKILDALSPRERRVLELRFGINTGDHAQQLDTTPERIRQIEAKALYKLRHPTRSKKLKSFVDVDVPLKPEWNDPAPEA